MSRIRLISLSIFIVFLSLSANAQDFIFSQYYNAPIQLNPAFAGNNNFPVFSANYRLQWPGLQSSYRSYALSYDQFINKFNSGVGFWISNDNQGDGTLETIKFNGIYSYKLRFQRDWQLKIGLEVGYAQSNLDWEKLIFYDQIDPLLGSAIGISSNEVRPDNLNRSYFDVSTGFLLYNPQYYLGFTMKHLNRAYSGFVPNFGVSEEGIPFLLSIHGGFQITLVEGNNRQNGTFISPNVLFARQGDFNQLNIGAYAQIRSIFGGIWLRHTIKNVDAVIFSAGFDTGDFKIGYSFDLTTSDLGISTGGSHELGITFKLRGLSNEESPMNDCLMLFR